MSQHFYKDDADRPVQSLKSCPFCASEAEFRRRGTAQYSCIIACTNCGCRLETGERGEQCGNEWNHTRAEGFTDWRRRYEDESAIVDKVWKVLGISHYEAANGKTIYELVADCRSQWVAMKDEIGLLRQAARDVLDNVEPHTCRGAFGAAIERLGSFIPEPANRSVP